MLPLCFALPHCTILPDSAGLLAKVLCFLSSQPLFTLHRIFCDLLRRIPGLMAVDSKRCSVVLRWSCWSSCCVGFSCPRAASLGNFQIQLKLFYDQTFCCRVTMWWRWLQWYQQRNAAFAQSQILVRIGKLRHVKSFSKLARLSTSEHRRHERKTAGK